MKAVLTGFLQFLLFLMVFAAGSLLNPFGLHWFVTHPTPLTERDFSPGGLLLDLGLYVILVALQGARKQLPRAAVITSAALAVALMLGLAAKFGFATREIF
jgi:hypothetical protein